MILQISDYIDGELDVAVKREIELHLEDCPDCMIIVNQTRRTVEIFCGSEPVELSQEVRSRLHEALRRQFRNP